MSARLAVLGAADVQDRVAAQLDLQPLEISDLAGAQAVPIANQDHGGIPTPVAAAAGRGDELFHLGQGQVFAGAQRWRACAEPCRPGRHGLQVRNRLTVGLSEKRYVARRGAVLQALAIFPGLSAD